jgi:nitrogen fixation/metabolism regulation signal transduction histidine kinase
MFLLMLVVPALMVVVVGYVVGHGLWAWFGGMVDTATGTSLAAGAEAAGWLTGALALAVVLRIGVLLLRWRSRLRRSSG